MSRPFAKGARANPPGNGPDGGRRAVPLESPETSARRGISALPDAPDAIRVDFDDDEPPALVFNDQAQPGALVSWAWCQLTALDALLRAIVERQAAGDDDADADTVGAVRNALVPVISALAFSERRAHDLRREREAAPAPRGRPRRGARKTKRAAK